MPPLLATLLAALAVGGDARPPDEVVLRTGERLTGQVVYEDAGSIVLRASSRDREIPVAEVERVDSRARRLKTGLERWRTTQPGDLGPAHELAAYFDGSGFEGEALLVRWWILSQQPGNEALHAELGHVRRGERWLVPLRPREIAFDELLRAREAWNSARTIDTEHFHLKSNLALADVVAVAFDLECAYRSFYAAFGADLRLFEVTERMPVEVHASSVSFPERAAGRRSYFDATTYAAFHDASAGVERWLVFHEVVHQILHATTRRSRGGRGDVPGWLEEGLAEYFATGMIGPPGRGEYREGLLANHHFEAHARSKDPYSLSRVLQFAASDYEASTGADLKYAQSYTFVHFCMLGERGAWRPGFLEYLRGVFLGRSSTGRLEDALGTTVEVLQRKWTEHVRGAAKR